MAFKVEKYAAHRFRSGDRGDVQVLHDGPQANTGLSWMAVRPASSLARFEVECRTADELVFEQNVPAPTLIKIDVEGWERQVLFGARRILAEKPPKGIVFESACDETGAISDQGLVRSLEDAGYRVQRLERPGGLIDLRENYLATHISGSF